MSRLLLEQEEKGDVGAFPGVGVVAEQGWRYETGLVSSAIGRVNTVTKALHELAADHNVAVPA